MKRLFASNIPTDFPLQCIWNFGQIDRLTNFKWCDGLWFYRLASFCLPNRIVSACLVLGRLNRTILDLNVLVDVINQVRPNSNRFSRNYHYSNFVRQRTFRIMNNGVLFSRHLAHNLFYWSFIVSVKSTWKKLKFKHLIQ